MRTYFFRTEKGTKPANKLISIFAFSISAIGGILWMGLVVFSFLHWQTSGTLFERALGWTNIVSGRLTFLTISFSGIYLLLKANLTKPKVYYVLLTAYLCFSEAMDRLMTNRVLPESWRPWLVWIYVIQCILLIRCVIEFPERLSDDEIKRVFNKSLLARGYGRLLNILKKAYWCWILLPFGIALTIIGFYSVFSSVCCIIALGYMVVHLRVAEQAHKKAIYWLLWALFVQFLWVLILLSIDIFRALPPHYALVVTITSIILSLSLLFAYVMTVFFSNLLDAKLIFQKTVTFGLIIFVFTLFFGIAEHLIIHQVSHYLEIESVYVSSAFACGMGMCFHPLKEKLMHWLRHLGHLPEHA